MTTETQTNEQPKLYAGKFKTIEDLEAGYKSSLPVFQENETLKKTIIVEFLDTIYSELVFTK
jgi:hypothetical protein